MENKFTKEQLHTFDKDILVTMILQQQDSLIEMNKKLDLLLEQIRISNQARFGHSSEKVELQNQLAFCFNEAEVTVADADEIAEPTIEQVVPEHKRRVKKKDKRIEDLSSFPVRVETHVIPEEKLQELFGGDHRKLPDEVYKKLEFHPATFEVVEHHIEVYCGNKNQKVVKADHPAELLNNSIATPSLVAAILNAKYVNWVYRTGEHGGVPPAVLYEYQKTRKADHPREFLAGYNGVVVCDGYQVYHKLGKERPDELGSITLNVKWTVENGKIIEYFPEITATAISTCEITDSDIPPFYLGQRAYVEGKVVWLPGFTGTITGWFYNDGVLDIY